MLGTGTPFTPRHSPLPATPARAAWRWYLAALLLAVAAVPAMQLDLPLAEFCLENHLPGDLRRLLTWSEAFAHGVGVALIALAAVSLDRWGRRYWFRILSTAYGAGLLANAVKLVVGRDRPHHYFSLLDGPLGAQTARDTFIGFWPPIAVQQGWDHAIQSFPSGHTATAFGFAAGLARVYPQAHWLFWCLAILAAGQRIDSGAHYLSDVLVGAALGLLAAALVTDPRRLGKCFDRLERPPRTAQPSRSCGF